MKTLEPSLPPEWAYTRHHFQGWNVRPTVLQEPRLMAKLHPESRRNAAACTLACESAKRQAGLCKARAQELREQAAEKHGDNKTSGPDLCRFPFSGGTCGHWPREDRDEILTWVRASQDWHALALAWHLHAGRRRDSFTL